MPELPEVETIKKDLEKQLIGQKIINVQVNDPMVVRGLSQDEFVKRLSGKSISDIQRRGKAIIFNLEPEDFLIIQLVMTGQLIYGKRLENAKVTFELSSGGFLNYNDQRRFGRLNVVKNLNELKFLQTLGLEPLNKQFSLNWFQGDLKKHKTSIKSLLMNQNVIAGIGNIYASEILFRSKINPQRRACRLSGQQVKILHQAVIDVLKEAIRLRGSSVRNYRDARGRRGRFLNYIQVYGRENKKCVICERPIIRIIQSGRSTFFCRRCQS